ncbi:MAG TPA: hypothetical protein VMF64_11350 [Steroidobacteraceae bacterium]|nr:hypothetical protein [Steroidobacteraceae bacterium]
MQQTAAHWLLTAIVFAALCAASVTRARARVRRRQLHGWLAALPVSDCVLAASVSAPVSALCISLLAIAVAWGAGLSAAAAGTLLLALGTAAALGVGLGWYWPHRQAPLIPPSWYTRIHRSPQAPWRARIWGLGTWPLACSQVWGRPKITSRQLAFLALGMPLGTPAIRALLVIGSALIVSHLLRMLAATARVAFPAARWLAPTPIGVVRLTCALIWLTLLRQAIVLALLVLFVGALPLALTGTQALARGADWLLLSLVISVAACAWAYAHGSPDRAPLSAWRSSRARFRDQR